MSIWRAPSAVTSRPSAWLAPPTQANAPERRHTTSRVGCQARQTPRKSRLATQTNRVRSSVAGTTRSSHALAPDRAMRLWCNAKAVKSRVLARAMPSVIAASSGRGDSRHVKNHAPATSATTKIVAPDHARAAEMTERADEGPVTTVRRTRAHMILTEHA